MAKEKDILDNCYHDVCEKWADGAPAEELLVCIDNYKKLLSDQSSIAQLDSLREALADLYFLN